ncbi:MAG TPA: hypothetical protein VJ787_05865 [Thermoleophilia bacterium]|nr:hypothetical protein [Thermoleophilia bacterium]
MPADGMDPQRRRSRLQLGENSTGRTFDVAFDDVAASTQFVN